jgi:hypothetical protein
MADKMARIWRTLCNLGRPRKGSSLVIVLAFATLGFLVVPPLLSYAYTASKSDLAYQLRISGLYAADSGVQDAYWQLIQATPDGTKVPSSVGASRTYTNINLNGQQVTVTILKQDDVTYKVTSSTPKASITSYMVSSLIPLFKYAVLALGGNVTLTGATQVTSSPTTPPTGDVFSAAGSISMANSSCQINGSAYADQNISGNGIITGSAEAQGTISSGTNAGGGKFTGSQTCTPPSQTDMTNLETQIYDLTYNIATGGTPVSSMSISNVGSSSNPFHYTAPIQVTGNMTFTSANYVVFDNTVTVGGSISINNAGSVTFNAPVKVGLDFTENNGVAINMASTLYVGGTLTVNNGVGMISGDAIYVGGSDAVPGNQPPALSLNNGAYIQTTANSPHKDVIAMGDVAMSGGTALGINQVPFVMTPNNFSLSNGAQVYAAVYAPNANFTATGNTRLYGAIVANSASLSNSAQVVYLPGVLGMGALHSTGTGGALVIQAWRSN